MHPYDFRHAYPEPYVPRRLTFEIVERIGADGEVVVALDVEQARGVLARLAALEVEAVAVALLWSIANGEHERRLGALCAELLPGVPVTLSHELNPVMREYRRTSCAAIDASLKPLMHAPPALDRERPARRAACAGGSSRRRRWAACCRSSRWRSGRSTRPSPARRWRRSRRGSTPASSAPGDAIVCDTGGTSFDVSLVRDGAPVFTRETWLGEPFSGHHTGLASVDVRSIGAGGGSIAWIDSGGLLRVGPQSAGADPGPAALRARRRPADRHRRRLRARLPRPGALPRRRDGARRGRRRAASSPGSATRSGSTLAGRRRGRAHARRRAHGRRDPRDHDQPGRRSARGARSSPAAARPGSTSPRSAARSSASAC